MYEKNPIYQYYIGIFLRFAVAGSVGLDDAALRRADELHEIVALGALGHRTLDLAAPVQIVQTALEQDTAGFVDFGDALGREAAARKPDFVDSGEAERIVADDDERRQVLPEEGAALNHGVRADAGPLVDGRVAADDDPVVDMDLASERNAVGDDAMAADDAIVADMDISHQQIAVADDGRARGLGAAADGDVLADVVAVADLAGGHLAVELEVLRQARHRSRGVDLTLPADAGPVVDDGPGTYPAIVADDHVARDAGERFYRDVGPQLGVGVNVSKRTDHLTGGF